MEMVIVITLGAIALGIIGQQNESMRQMQRARVKRNERTTR